MNLSKGNHQDTKAPRFGENFLPVSLEADRWAKMDAGFRIDLLVQDELVVEIKAVDIMLPVFDAQLLTYLKLAKKRLGLLINFNVPRIKDGIKRIIL